jgi:hypothetical protein
MTPLRQIEANRRNALKSTGPRTENGKRRSRRNAFRHGLTAETVIEVLEDTEDYRGFEAAHRGLRRPNSGRARAGASAGTPVVAYSPRATSVETGFLRNPSGNLAGSPSVCEPISESARNPEHA